MYFQTLNLLPFYRFDTHTHTQQRTLQKMRIVQLLRLAALGALALAVDGG